jgi:hypothetical protein
LRWWRHVYIVDVRGGLIFVDETAALAVSAHDAFAADHGVCDVFGAVAFREAGVFAHGAETRVVAEESVDAFGVEDVVAGEFADGVAGFVGRGVGGDEVV